MFLCFGLGWRSLEKTADWSITFRQVIHIERRRVCWPTMETSRTIPASPLILQLNSFLMQQWERRDLGKCPIPFLRMFHDYFWSNGRRLRCFSECLSERAGYKLLTSSHVSLCSSLPSDSEFLKKPKSTLKRTLTQCLELISVPEKLCWWVFLWLVPHFDKTSWSLLNIHVYIEHTTLDIWL